MFRCFILGALGLSVNCGTRSVFFWLFDVFRKLSISLSLVSQALAFQTLEAGAYRCRGRLRRLAPSPRTHR